jgi:hypothetical protein
MPPGQGFVKSGELFQLQAPSPCAVMTMLRFKSAQLVQVPLVIPDSDIDSRAAIGPGHSGQLPVVAPQQLQSG